MTWSWLGRGTDAKNTSSVMETERFHTYLKGDFIMKAKKIVEFAKNNWTGIGILMMFAAAETAIVTIYKKSMG